MSRLTLLSVESFVLYLNPCILTLSHLDAFYVLYNGNGRNGSPQLHSLKDALFASKLLFLYHMSPTAVISIAIHAFGNNCTIIRTLHVKYALNLLLLAIQAPELFDPAQVKAYSDPLLTRLDLQRSNCANANPNARRASKVYLIQ